MSNWRKVPRYISEIHYEHRCLNEFYSDNVGRKTIHGQYEVGNFKKLYKFNMGLHKYLCLAIKSVKKTSSGTNIILYPTSCRVGTLIFEYYICCFDLNNILPLPVFAILSGVSNSNMRFWSPLPKKPRDTHLPSPELVPGRISAILSFCKSSRDFCWLGIFPHSLIGLFPPLKMWPWYQIIFCSGDSLWLIWQLRRYVLSIELSQMKHWKGPYFWTMTWWGSHCRNHPSIDSFLNRRLYSENLDFKPFYT